MRSERYRRRRRREKISRNWEIMDFFHPNILSLSLAKVNIFNLMDKNINLWHFKSFIIKNI